MDWFAAGQHYWKYQTGDAVARAMGSLYLHMRVANFWCISARGRDERQIRKVGRSLTPELSVTSDRLKAFIGDALANPRPLERAGNPFLAWLYLVYALPTIIFLAISVAPFQVPDEDNHALRADQISRGTLLRPGGGSVDGGIVELRRLFSEMHFHSERKQTREISNAAAKLNWAASNRDESFQNTAQYGPLLYLPQVVGIWIGKLLGLSVVWTILLARLINGFLAACIGFISICICRRGQALLFTTLLLPMTLSQFASVSQDALIISLSILAGAVGSRVVAEQRSARNWEFSLWAFIVVATTMARPSQIALVALAPAFVGRQDVFSRPKLLIGLVALVALGCWLVILSGLMPSGATEGSTRDHLAALIVHPMLFPELVYNTFWKDLDGFLLPSIVGRLAWGDTFLPNWYYQVACAAVVLAWLAPGNLRPYLLPAITGVFTCLLIVLTLSFALYVSWTPISKMSIDGFQGRYFLSVLPLLGWTAPVYRPLLARLLSPVWIAVATLPIVTLAVLPDVIVERFYGSWPDMEQALKLMYLT